MTDFYGTTSADTIIENKIDPKYDGSIYALAGDDIIYARLKSVLPGPGNDVIISYKRSANVIYWDAPSAVQINLLTGFAQDGYGGTDLLKNVRTAIGTRFDDVFIASDSGSSYFPNGGSDVITGGAGYDKVNLYISGAEDFIDIVKSKSKDGTYSLTYKSNGQVCVISLDSVEQIKIYIGATSYKTFNLSEGILETLTASQKYLLIAPDQFLGNYKFERTSNLHIKVTNIVTNIITDLGPEFVGFKYKEQTVNFSETGMPNDKIPWFHTIFTDPKTNDQYLLLSTLSSGATGGEALLYTPSSPVVVYGVKDGKVIDDTNSFFKTIPQTYWTRDIHVGDINGDGFNDVFFSNQGREVASFQDAPIARNNPVWGERNQLFFGSALGWTEASIFLPNSVDFSHGSSLADIDGDGTDEIIVNNLGSFDGFPNRYILKWSNGQLKPIYINSLQNINSSFTLAGDINHDGFDDVVIGSLVFWGGKDFGNQTSALPITRNQQSGFTNWHGGQLADFNGDGYLDILKISASDGSASNGLGAWQGLKMDLFLYSPKGWIDSSSNFSNYAMDQFGINVSIIDLDFDGHLDILTSGPRYFYGQSKTDDNQYFFRNDGTGHFQLLKMNQENPQNSVFFLQSANGTISVISIEENGYVYSKSEELTPADIHLFLGEWGAGQTQLAGFDSQFYINTYPEVATLITQGAYLSALDHYLQIGKTQGKYTFAPDTIVWGTSKDDAVVLREGSETAQLGEGNDRVEGLAGNDTIDGGSGIDTVIYSGAKSAYVITINTSSVTVSSGVDGRDTLKNIERLQFSDKTVALDISGTAGQAYRIYQAAFNRTPDNGGLKYWIGLMDSGVSLPTVSSAFIGSAEFQKLYGINPSNELFVTKLYDNVLHRAPDAGGYKYWVDLLNSRTIDKTSTLVNFSESNENQVGVIGVIQNGIDLFN